MLQKDHAPPFLIIRDGYEGVVVYAFFYLMLQYLSDDPMEQRKFLRRNTLFDHKNTWKWMFPMGWLKYRPEVMPLDHISGNYFQYDGKDGLYFLQLMKWGVLQYCVIRPRLARVHQENVHNPYLLRIHSGTLVRHEHVSQCRNVTESVPQISVITEAAGLYCENSWSPTWAHVYVCGLLLHYYLFFDWVLSAGHHSVNLSVNRNVLSVAIVLCDFRGHRAPPPPVATLLG